LWGVTFLNEDQYESHSDILSDYLKSLFGIEPLTTKEEHALAERIQQGDENALNKLVKHNLRFVVYLLRNTTAWRYGKTPPEDLLAMGNEQLVISARRWIPTNNARFATYARSFILRGVTRELDNTEKLIRLPINIMEAIKKMNYNERALAQVLNRKPKISEIATMMGVSVEKVRQLQFHLMREPISIDGKNNEEAIHEDDIE
jgi:RNA polymerase primary sigma factor